MENFIQWTDMLQFATLSMVVFSIVNFTKEIKFIKQIPTKYYSWLVAFVLILLVNVHQSTFAIWDILLYMISAMFISLSSNGVANFNVPKQEVNKAK
jgi:hypothetical protein